MIGRLVCDADYRITSVDEALAATLGYSVSHLVSSRAIDLVDPADRLCLIEAARAAVRGDEPMVTVSCTFLGADGGAMPLQLAMSGYRPDADRAPGLVCAVVAADVSGRRTESLLVAARIAAVAHADLLRLLHTTASAANAAGSLREAVDAIVPSVCLHFGWRAGALVRWRGDDTAQISAVHGTAQSLMDGSLNGSADGGAPGASGWPFDHPMRPRRGSRGVILQHADHPLLVVPVTDTAAVVFAGAVDRAALEVEALAAIAGDLARVADREAALAHAERSADSLRRRAAHASERTAGNRHLAVDSLTGLATRSQLLAELDRAVIDHGDGAVLLVDLDDFKAINDTYGHETGDEVLVEVANRLRACVRPDDLVVRFGGDEFVVLCRIAAAAVTVAQRVVALLAPPIATTAGDVTVTASVGISDRGIPVDTAADLLTRADAAMYWAKKLGKNRYFRYDDHLHARAARDKQTESLLRTAVLDRRVVVHYQPIMATTGAGIVGVEAVTRLIDDDGRIRLPGEFLPVAERTGLIAAVDEWVLAESCRRIAEVGGRLGRPLTVSVNVSAQLAARPDLVDTVGRALTAAGLPASSLMLELTEGTLIQAGTAIIERLAALRERGVRVALDNFGAGYSPLAFLRRLPLSHVKVDRPCINRMLSDERDAAMLEAVTWLVGQLGLTWIAEGVETDAQWEAVRRFGPGFAQGYLFAGPLAEDELVRTLRGDLPGRPFTARATGFVSL